MAVTRRRKLIASTHEKLAIDVLKQFRLIYGAVRQHFREVEKQCGISGSQLWVIREIGKQPGIGVTELAKRLSIHQSTCSLLIKTLVKNGYVKRTTDRIDQRRVGLVISSRAVKALERAPGPAEGVLPQALSKISTTSLRNLETHLTKVIAELQGMDNRYGGQPLADL